MKAKLKRQYDALSSSDVASIREALTEKLADIHPELVVKVKNIRYGDDQMFVDLRVRLTNDVRKVAANRDLVVFEKIGEYSLVDWDPINNPAKPYVLRDSKGDEYVVGHSVVEKTFKKQKEKRR